MSRNIGCTPRLNQFVSERDVLPGVSKLLCIKTTSKQTDKRVLKGGYQSHFPAHFFSKSHFPVLKSHSQCYTYQLFSLRIRKITTSKYDPTKTQKFTRIYKDVLKITGSFQTVIKLSSSEFIAISPCHFTFLPFLPAGNLPSDL